MRIGFGRKAWAGAGVGSELEETLLFQIRVAGLPLPEREYRFDPKRRWRFDFAWPDPAVMLAVECEGGTYIFSRHVRPGGYERDLQKANTAVLRGWRVLRFTRQQIESGEAIKVVEEALGHAIWA